MTIEFTEEQINQIKSSNLKGKNLNFLLFVGHAHSGHSLIGALVDAHPDAIVANEVNIVKSIDKYKLNKHQIFNLLISAYQNNKDGWKNSEYRYNLPNTYQGLLKTPKIVGDKKAGGSTRIIFNNPSLYDYILSEFGANLRVVYVQREAIDIIASYSYYMKQPPCLFNLNRYNENLETVQSLKSKTPGKQFHTIIQEDFTKTPTQHMIALYEFLDLTTTDLVSDIKTWTGIVKSDLPKKSDYIKIDKELIKKIKPT